MSKPFDLVIRNGMLADGSGGEPYQADVAVRDGRIAAVGKISESGTKEIDAKGLLVTPGFVDIHTHYDGQATWDSYMEPSSSHGVSTVVMGNCGVGFAPCRAEDRDTLISLMEGVEDIPGAALAEGLKWDWESFPDYLDALERRKRDIDVAAQIPHGALRVFAMGARGAAREDATEDDIALMRTLVDEGMRAGALGVASSRTINHRTAGGDLTPMYGAAARELAGLSDAIGKRGVFQLVSDFMDEDAEFGLLEAAAKGGALSASFSLLQVDPVPDKWRSLLNRVEAANAQGLPILAQVMCRPVGVLMGLDTSIHPFMKRPHYMEIEHLPLAQRAAAMRESERKAAILGEGDAGKKPPLGFLSQAYWKLFPLGDPPDYAPPESASFKSQAEAQGRDPAELIYDHMLTDDGRAIIYLPLFNFTTNTLEPVAEMLRHPLAIHGLGDGGAHVGTICDGSTTTYLLSRWVRDDKKIPIGQAVAMLSRKPAEAVGLFDRGRIAVGMKADINVIDVSSLAIEAPRIAHDLPAGGRRFLQGARGYKASIVSGVVTRRDGARTGALPGKLVRGRQKPTLAAV